MLRDAHINPGCNGSRSTERLWILENARMKIDGATVIEIGAAQGLETVYSMAPQADHNWLLLSQRLSARIVG